MRKPQAPPLSTNFSARTGRAALGPRALRARAGITDAADARVGVVASANEDRSNDSRDAISGGPQRRRDPPDSSELRVEEVIPPQRSMSCIGTDDRRMPWSRPAADRVKPML